MRIALLTYSTRPRGGVVHTLALAEALADLGQQVDVWSLARGGDEGFFREVSSSVRLRLVPFPDVDGESVGERIMRSISLLGSAFSGVEGAYDVVHAQDCISANAVPNCIRTIHHLDNFQTPELVACHERAITQPSAHICVSQAVADEVVASYGIEPTVIPNGVDAERFRSAAAADSLATQARDDWTLQLGDYVVSVGGIEPRKGTIDLVRAMATVQESRPGLQLVIAGGETLFDYRSYRDEVFALADELGLRWTVLGPVDHDRLPSLVAAAKVFAFPSTKEGFGMAAMEALAAGRPVVMRELPVLREVFGDAVSFSETAEQLAAAIIDPPPPSAAAAKLVNRHTWPIAAQSHLDFYAANKEKSAAVG